MTRIVRWNPVREMAAMQNALDRMFEETWRNVQDFENALALDVYETDNSYIIHATLPGMNPDDINVTLHDGNLTISGELVKPEMGEDVRVLANERGTGRFTRSLNLPHAVNMDGIEAEYHAGILELTLPKVPEVQPRKIAIKANGNN